MSGLLFSNQVDQYNQEGYLLVSGLIPNSISVKAEQEMWHCSGEGIPSLVVLDSKGKMQFVTLGGELATAREMSGDDLIGWLKEHIQPILD